MAKLEPYSGDYYLWEYVPSMPASIIFFFLFLGATAFHCWKTWTTKSRFCIPFWVGGLCSSALLSLFPWTSTDVLQLR